MKRIKLWLLVAASALALSACGSQDDTPKPLTPETISMEQNDSKTPEQEESKEETAASNESVDAPASSNEDDTNPPAEGMLRSRLTNEWVDAEVANTRPIAVMTPNEISAVPHYNLSNASVIYEANVEGRMTRMLALYENWEGLDKIGNIRSLRAYFGYWALEWDAFIVHFGGPYFVDEVLDKPNVEDIDGNLGSDSAAFFRTTDRKAPHNAYGSGEGLKKVIEQKGMSLTYRNLADENHFNFTAKANPNTLDQYSGAITANKIDMSSYYPMTRCRFEYNPEDGLYYRYQHLSGASDGPHMDAATGEQLTFKNILVQNVKHEELGKGYLAFQVHDTTKDGWYFTNGKGIHVTWKKTSDWGATRYYDDNGNEITLNTGKTMILIVEDADNFSTANSVQ